MTRLQPQGAATLVAAQQLQPTALAAISSHILAGSVQLAGPHQRLRRLEQANHTTCTGVLALADPRERTCTAVTAIATPTFMASSANASAPCKPPTSTIPDRAPCRSHLTALRAEASAPQMFILKLHPPTEGSTQVTQTRRAPHLSTCTATFILTWSLFRLMRITILFAATPDPCLASVHLQGQQL